MWCTLIVMVSTVSAYYYANLVAFKDVNLEHFKDDHGDDGANVYPVLFEAIFLLDFLMKFLVDYEVPNPTGKSFLQRDYKKIAVHYYETEFWTDFIPLFPL